MHEHPQDRTHGARGAQEGESSVESEQRRRPAAVPEPIENGGVEVRDGDLLIRDVNSALAMLERRLQHVSRRAADPGLREQARSYDRSESIALRKAIACLRFHRAASEPETDPVLALGRLVDAIGANLIPDAEIADALEHARRVLAALGEES